MSLRTRLNSLNGWRRMWLALVVVGLVAIWTYSFLIAPVQYPMQYDLNVASAFKNADCQKLLNLPAGTEISSSPPIDDPCRPLWDYRLRHRASNALDEAEYGKEIQHEQFGDEAQFAAILSAAFAVVAALVYATGSGIGWITQGFKKSL